MSSLSCFIAKYNISPNIINMSKIKAITPDLTMMPLFTDNPKPLTNTSAGTARIDSNSNILTIQCFLNISQPILYL